MQAICKSPTMRIGCLLDTESVPQAFYAVEGVIAFRLSWKAFEDIDQQRCDAVICDVAYLSLIDRQIERRAVLSRGISLFLLAHEEERVPAKFLAHPLIANFIVLSYCVEYHANQFNAVLQAHKTHPKNQRKDENGENRLFLDKLNGCLESRLAMDCPGVGDLARDMGVSAKTLCRKIQAYTGLPTVRYLLRQRLLLARQWLDLGIVDLRSVAIKTGFLSYSYFAKCFKKEFGVLPSRYIG